MLDTDQKLHAFLPELRAAKWVAVDTEADSLHAYPEKVCLIQISTAEGDRLIDPLVGLELAPLLEALVPHQLIMHGADYDLRLLRKHHDFVPRTVFDTMLAARILGMRQFGLSHLAEVCLGVKLEKGPQKANWALRPLTDRMERYARNDTHYLKPLADKLTQDLVAKGRLAWHQEACARLIQEAAQDRPPDEDIVWRLRGSHILGRSGLAVLRQLWHWREGEARAANKPPFFVLSHELLVELSCAAATRRPVAPLLPRHLSERRRSTLMKAIAKALEAEPDSYPKILKPSGRKPNEDERKRFLELQQKRDHRAAELDIDPTLIASRSALSDLAHDWDEYAATLMKWQLQLLT